jgi:serine/threonine protein kinase
VREARLLVRLRHPNVVRFVGVGAARPADPWRTLFLVQEFCDRGSMKARLFRQMQEPFRHAYAYAEALRWSAEIAAGLAFLHAARPKVIHRDLKADNVLLATGPGGAEVAKIADLGLHVLVQNASLARSGGSATPRSGGSSLHGGDAAALALADAGSPMRADAVAPNAPSGGRALSYVLTGRTGAFCYMAPEVLMGQPYSESVDVFSLGVIMHELFSRRLLCAALMNTNEWDESEGHARRVAAGFRPAIPAELPAELRALIDACWHGVPELRPSAREVVRRLAAIKATGALAAMDAERAAAKGGACCAVQ